MEIINNSFKEFIISTLWYIQFSNLIVLILFSFFTEYELLITGSFNYKTITYIRWNLLSAGLKKLYNSDIFDFKIKENFSQCSQCNLKRDMTYANSQKNDVIICASFGIIRNSCLFVRTLRATGSKAQVVILVDSNCYKSIDKVTFDELMKCGTTIVDCGTFNLPTKKRMCTLKFVLSHMYIRRNYYKMNRIIIMDLFDSVFQSDPFNVQIGKENELNVVHEGMKLINSPRNIGFLNEWRYEPTSTDLFTYYKCSGYFGGTAETMRKFTELCFELMYSYEDRDDQGMVNFIIYSGLAGKKGINISPDRKIELVRHCAIKKLTNTYGNVTSIRDNKVRAAVIHHYYRNKKFIQSVIEACPMKEGQLNYASPYKPSKGQKFLEKTNLIKYAPWNKP